MKYPANILHSKSKILYLRIFFQAAGTWVFSSWWKYGMLSQNIEKKTERESVLWCEKLSSVLLTLSK